jgi:hypothetical protein
MENKKFKISKENYELLFAMIELAEKRKPVQGEFSFRSFNYKKDGNPYESKEGVENCGTIGCLAGGYLPLIDKERFNFSKYGLFFENEKFFTEGKLQSELGNYLFNALFMIENQSKLGLKDLSAKATLKEVIENAKKVLELYEIEK